MRILTSKKGEGTYISTVIFVLVAVLFIAFTVRLFSIISAKQQMDACADQMVRQIQLAGEVDDRTDALFASYCGRIAAVHDLQYEIDTVYKTGRKIQLGMPFTVTVTAEAYMGDFGGFGLFPLTLVSQCGGVSEEYWK